MQKLEAAGRTLKNEFVGLDGQIDIIINAMRPWYLLPETLQRPIVIGLWGRTGVGKTSLILRLVEILELGSRFGMEDLGKFTSGERLNQSEDMGLFEKYFSLAGQACVFLIDEIQTARTRDAGGVDMDRPNLRDLWTFLDTGKVSRDFRTLENYLFTYSDRLRYIRTSPSPPLATDVGQWDVEQLRRYLGVAENSLDLVASWTADPVRFFENAVQELRKLRAKSPYADFSRSLVFVASNLDEAFSGSEITDPNVVLPDDLHEVTSKVTINDVKRALLARFRPEQVARMGSTHILFPGFTPEHYRALIDLKLKDLALRIRETQGLRVEFEESVKTLLYSEAVIPTQGARPVISLISEFIESQIPSWITGVRLAGREDVALQVRYDPSTKILRAHGPGLAAALSRFFESRPVVSQTELRRRHYDSVLRRVVAVHEAGHVTAGIAAYGMLPKQIHAAALHTSLAGHTEFENFPILNYTLALGKLACGLGGMAAELRVFKKENLSSGSFQDLQEATMTASQLVTQLGMGPHLGQSFQDPGLENLITFKSKDDKLKEKWLQAALAQAKAAIAAQQPFFSALVRYLLNETSLSGEELRKLFLEFYEAPPDVKRRIADQKRPLAYEAYNNATERFLTKPGKKNVKLKKG